MSTARQGRSGTPVTDLAMGCLVLGLATALVMWLGACLAAVVGGDRVPAFDGAAALLVIQQWRHPAVAWRMDHLNPVVYWLLTVAVAGTFAIVGVCLHRGWTHRAGRASRDPRRLAGMASATDVRSATSRRTVVRRARTVRPSRRRVEAADVGYALGRFRGRGVWASVEDSILLVGPPRAGKGLHLVIPALLNAPGAVVTTSTRPDNLAVTMAARSQCGPVAVFDPQRLAAGVSSGLRWSPIRGCELPQTAMVRARGLAAGTGMSRQVEGGDFWQGQTEAVLRSLLHAAALDGRPARDLYRWALDPAATTEAVAVLGRDRDAAEGWDDALEQATRADPRTRDSIWLGVRQSVGSLADPRVLDAVSPRPGEEFDPEQFLRDRGTLYLLGTSSGAGAAAPLVSALIEDLVETVRRLAAASPGARLDPPLLMALDEIGNLAPLPSLPTLMSEGGGSGITTLAVLQSLSQARDRWGEQAAHTIWDASIVKLILGGGSNARDLADLSSLIGERDDLTESVSRDASGARSTSTTVRRVPVMDPSRLRMLPFGIGVLLLRSAPPIVLDLVPWTSRRDAAALSAARTDVEDQLRQTAAGPRLARGMS